MDRYEEALERAKQGLPLDEVFPELKESEEDRIRKAIGYAICAAAHEDGTLINDVTRDKALAYLEKQKEQPTNEEMLRTLRVEYEKGVADTIAKYEQKEPLPVPDKFSGLKSLMLQYLQSAANRKDDTEIESDTDLWGRKILDYVWKHDEKPKEQRPAEWSEEDEDIVSGIIGDINAMMDRLNHPELKALCEKEKDWLKSLPERFNPQAKQEWKEEDKVILGLIQDAVDKFDFDNVQTYYAVSDFLKSLRPQPKQGWSKEDEVMLCRCISATFDHGYLRECDWLKSLRSQPHWKPSEEQMLALMYAANDSMMRYDYNASQLQKEATRIYSENLQSLYNDLKKL